MHARAVCRPYLLMPTTIRAPPPSHDGTGVRLRLEPRQQAVRHHVDVGRSSRHWGIVGGQEARIRILGIVGSLGAKSSNLSLLETAASVAPEGSEVALYTRLGELPHFDPDIDPDDAPSAVRVLRQAIAA